MLIGIDFDNTIAGYDRVFVRAARCERPLPDGTVKTKRGVRDALRERPDGEDTWMRLQGRVYGAHMNQAELIDGVGDFLSRCRNSGIPVCIVSHKTKFGHFDPDRINLREAAMNWMVAKGFFDGQSSALAHESVFFESTREAKVSRIADLGCSHFIDDLEEVLLDPGFPESTMRYLFAGGGKELPAGPFKAFRTWREISDDILGSSN